MRDHFFVGNVSMQTDNILLSHGQYASAAFLPICLYYMILCATWPIASGGIFQIHNLADEWLVHAVFTVATDRAAIAKPS
jgi:hypothetical protein